MTWKEPHNWAVGDVLTADRLHTVNDSLRSLKNPPSKQIWYKQSATTSSASFVAVDTSKLQISLLTGGGDVMVGFTGHSAPNGYAAFDVLVKTPLGPDRYIDGTTYGITRSNQNVTFVVLADATEFNINEANQTYTFELHWRFVNEPVHSTMTSVGVHRICFWAREVS
jgi:hypothetical protein